MSLSRTALVLGLLCTSMFLNACSVGTVTASSRGLPSAPGGSSPVAGPAGNTPVNAEKTTFERASLERGSNQKDNAHSRCRHCD